MRPCGVTGCFRPCGFLIAQLPARVGSLTALLGCSRFSGIEWGHGNTGRRHDRLFGDLLGDLANIDMLTMPDDLPQGFFVGPASAFRCPRASSTPPP
jgi:hypothetical protein